MDMHPNSMVQSLIPRRLRRGLQPFAKRISTRYQAACRVVIHFLNFETILKILSYLGLAFLLLPVILVLPISLSADQYLSFPPKSFSFKWYQNVFSNSIWYIPLIRSISIAFSVGVISVLFGLIASYSMCFIENKNKTIIVFALLLPLIIPTAIVGMGLLFLYADLRIIDTYLGVICGHVVLALPFSILIISTSLSRSELFLEKVAQVFGATRIYSFVIATLPQIKRGLLIAFISSFLVSFDEPVVVLFISGANTRTLPRQLLDGIRYNLDPTAAAISGIFIVLSIIVNVYFVIKNKKGAQN